MKRYNKQDIASMLADVLSINISADWYGVDPVMPALEKMRADGSVLLIKLDGERAQHWYTVVVKGGLLGEEAFRTDADTLEEALCYVIGNYAQTVWSRPRQA